MGFVIWIVLLLLPGIVGAEASQEVLQALGSGFGKFTPLGLGLAGFSLISIMAIIVAWEILRSDKGQREKIDIQCSLHSGRSRQDLET